MDWRLQLPDDRRRRLRAWFLTGAWLTFLIVVIGGITRLTQSGLSIVDWRPIMGVIPPLNEEQWVEAFERYRQFPEYQVLRRGMSLDEFKFIFFWEYVHRLAARLIGLVFLVPFLYFWLRGYFNRPLLRRVLVLFALGAAQGVLGWLMVRSGLVDRPSVSHYRLAAHLSLALLILGACVWLARQMNVARGAYAVETARGAGGTRLVYGLGALLALQIVWGAFVAGLHAGLIFNTFPLMGDGLVPPGAWILEPTLTNLVENPATVQWVHRVLGTLLLLAAAAVHWRNRNDEADRTGRRLSAAFLLLVLGQYGLGVVTLLLRVPIALGTLHQAVAAVIVVLWVVCLHHLSTRARARPGRPSVRTGRLLEPADTAEE
jgi:heme a synthase